MTYQTVTGGLGEEHAASPSRMIVLLYEEVVRSLEFAVRAIETGDIGTRCHCAERATHIVGHLYESLDMENGGEVAANLARVYRVILARLVMINPRNDADRAREAIALIRPLLDAWRTIDRQAAEAQLPATVSTPAAYAARA